MVFENRSLQLVAVLWMLICLAVAKREYNGTQCPSNCVCKPCNLVGLKTKTQLKCKVDQLPSITGYVASSKAKCL